MAISLGIYPTFSDKPILGLQCCHPPRVGRRDAGRRSLAFCAQRFSAAQARLSACRRPDRSCLDLTRLAGDQRTASKVNAKIEVWKALKIELRWVRSVSMKKQQAKPQAIAVCRKRWLNGPITIFRNSKSCAQISSEVSVLHQAL